MGQSPKITVCISAEEILQLRPLWEQICPDGQYTIFQDFGLNLLAAEKFADREQPYVVCAETPNGAAIVPAVLRHSDHSIRLLGEELFDYRCFLHDGDDQLCEQRWARFRHFHRWGVRWKLWPCAKLTTA